MDMFQWLTDYYGINAEAYQIKLRLTLNLFNTRVNTTCSSFLKPTLKIKMWKKEDNIN